MTLTEKIKFIEDFEDKYYVWKSQGNYVGILWHTAKNMVDELKIEINYLKIKNDE